MDVGEPSGPKGREREPKYPSERALMIRGSLPRVL
jgi:hypothetical protein